MAETSEHTCVPVLAGEAYNRHWECKHCGCVLIPGKFLDDEVWVKYE